MHLPGALVRRQQTGQDPQDGGSNGPPDEPPITTVGGNGKSTVMPVRQFQRLLSPAVVLTIE